MVGRVIFEQKNRPLIPSPPLYSLASYYESTTGIGILKTSSH